MKKLDKLIYSQLMNIKEYCQKSTDNNYNKMVHIESHYNIQLSDSTISKIQRGKYIYLDRLIESKKPLMEKRDGNIFYSNPNFVAQIEKRLQNDKSTMEKILDALQRIEKTLEHNFENNTCKNCDYPHKNG